MLVKKIVIDLEENSSNAIEVVKTPDNKKVLKFKQDVKFTKDVVIAWGNGKAISIGEDTSIKEGCQIAEDVRIGRACVLSSDTRVGKSTFLDDGVNLMFGAKVGRDCKIGKDVQVDFGTTISPFCKIGRGVYFPPAVTLRTGVNIEPEVLIMAC